MPPVVRRFRPALQLARLALATLSLLLVPVACQDAGSATPVPDTILDPGPPAEPEAELECAAAIAYTQTGVASLYGQPHHGRRTANGEIFDMNAMTAAHRSLPLGTHILVTNLDNGRAVNLRINDRGPYAKRRVLDVSAHAANVLGFTKKGLAKVRIETVSTCEREEMKRNERIAGDPQPRTIR